VDAALAREIREFRSPTDGETRMFYEIVIAPSYTPEGLEVLKGKSKTVSRPGRRVWGAGVWRVCGWVERAVSYAWGMGPRVAEWLAWHVYHMQATLFS
jgi:hypothetical protein